MLPNNVVQPWVQSDQMAHNDNTTSTCQFRRNDPVEQEHIATMLVAGFQLRVKPMPSSMPGVPIIIWYFVIFILYFVSSMVSKYSLHIPGLCMASAILLTSIHAPMVHEVPNRKDASHRHMVHAVEDT
jgi:hypothetical protein